MDPSVLPDVVVFRISNKQCVSYVGLSVLTYVSLTALFYWHVPQYSECQEYTCEIHGILSMLMCLTLFNIIKLIVGPKSLQPCILLCCTLNALYCGTYLIIWYTAQGCIFTPAGHKTHILRYIEWVCCSPLVILLSTRMGIVESKVDSHLQLVKHEVLVKCNYIISASNLLVYDVTMILAMAAVEVCQAWAWKVFLSVVSAGSFLAVQSGFFYYLRLPSRPQQQQRSLGNDHVVFMLRCFTMATFFVYPCIWAANNSGRLDPRYEAFGYFYTDLLMKVGFNACVLALNSHATEEALQVNHQFLKCKMEQEKEETEHLMLEHTSRMQQNQHNLLKYLFHEVRNPLHSATLAIMDACDEMGSTTTFTLGYEAIRSICDLLDNTNRLQMYNDNVVKLDSTTFSIVRTVRAVVDVFQSTIDSKKLTVRVHIDEHIDRVVGDEPKFRQVLLQLVSNAVKFNALSGVLTVMVQHVQQITLSNDHKPLINSTDSHVVTPEVRRRTLKPFFRSPLTSSPRKLTSVEKDRFWLRVTVQDSGPGILPEEHHKLFKPYEIMKSGLDAKRNFTGLGLSVAHTTVTLLGGYIGVNTSIEPGDSGSEFFVILPFNRVQDATPARSPLMTHAKRVQQNIAFKSLVSILVVDDDTPTRRLIVRGLKRRNAVCAQATNGQEAVEMVKEHVFDFIIMDLSMPVMNGDEAVRIMRTMGYQGMIVGVTADVSSEDAERFSKAGINRLLSKPVTVDQIVQELLATR